MKLVWQKTKSGPDDHWQDFTAVTSGGIYVGRIYRIESGSQAGLWYWTFLLGHSQFRQGTMRGEAVSKRSAADCVRKTYEAYLETPESDGGGKSRIPLRHAANDVVDSNPILKLVD
jgi:hypothetical protein